MAFAFLTFILAFSQLIEATPATHGATNSIEIMAIPPALEDAITSLAVKEQTMYQDMMSLLRTYAPSLVHLMETFQIGEFWEMTKASFWRWISFLMGTSSHGGEVSERSGQSNHPIFTVPILDIPVTRQRLEGFVIDSVAVYQKWQKS